MYWIVFELQMRSGEVDGYVRLTLFDPSNDETEAFRTKVEDNDTSPRFDEKFDFINVPTTSIFTATVFDKRGLIEGHMTLKPWKQVCPRIRL